MGELEEIKDKGEAPFEDIGRHRKKYLIIFLTLLVLTAVTVWASRWETVFYVAIAIALMIAILKGSLVAGYFMHLTSERKIIYIILLFVLIFFAALMALPVLTMMDAIRL